MEAVKEKEEVSDEDEESEPEEIEEKPFIDRVQDLLSSLKCVIKEKHDIEESDNPEENGKKKRNKKKKKKVITYEEDVGLLSFQKAIDGIKKKKGEIREALEDALKEIFEEFFTEWREQLLEENMEFLTKEDIEIIFGDSGTSCIKISEIYRNLNKNNPELIDSVDASIYFLIQHVCPEEDLDKVLQICENFEQDNQGTGSNFLDFVGNIVGRVSEKLGNADASSMETEDGKIDKNAIGTVVQDLIGDDVIQGSMQSMMKNITSDDFDINSVFKGLFKMQNNKSKKE